MLISEFSDQFDVLYNNITSNQAPGLNEYEKSLFLTKAEKEIVKNYFTANSKGNTVGHGFDDSAKRQADFSVLMKTSICVEGGPCILSCAFDGNTVTKNLSDIILTDDNGKEIPWDVASLDTAYTISRSGADNDYTIYIEGETYYVEGFPFELGEEDDGTITRIENSAAIFRIDPRSMVYSFPKDAYIVINEALYTTDKKILQIVPLRYDEYMRFMSKPFKRPLKNQAWRLMNSGDVVGDKGAATKYVEIITNSWNENEIASYNIRYVRVPKPIIVAPLGDDLTIDGEHGPSNQCEIDPILHEDILQRAVELAKIAWTATGQDNAQMVLQAGQRSE